MQHTQRQCPSAAAVSRGGANRKGRRLGAVWQVSLGGLLLATCAGCLQFLNDPTFGDVSDQVEEMAWQKAAPVAVDKLGVLAFKIRMRTLQRSRNAADLALAEKVKGRILEAVAQTDYADTARRFDWEVVVVRGDEPDAMAFPGGKIIVWTGLLRSLGTARPTLTPENQLAVALGHEVVHAVARHAAQRIDKELRHALLLAMEGKELSESGLDPAAAAGLMAAMGVEYEGAVVLPFTGDQESEADHQGLLLLARAGYDPAGAVRFWDQIKQFHHGKKPSEFLTMHPDYDVRIEQLNVWMAEAQQHYRSAAAHPVTRVGASG